MELTIKNLTKSFKDKTAVDDVSLTITPGVWGLLGANGAGKTTLMRMIAGILTPLSLIHILTVYLERGYNRKEYLWL